MSLNTPVRKHLKWPRRFSPVPGGTKKKMVRANTSRAAWTWRNSCICVVFPSQKTAAADPATKVGNTYAIPAPWRTRYTTIVPRACIACMNCNVENGGTERQDESVQRNSDDREIQFNPVWRIWSISTHMCMHLYMLVRTLRTRYSVWHTAGGHTASISVHLDWHP